jgi:guanine deaminase
MRASSEDTTFLGEAIRLAEQNVHDGGGPFGAVIVRDGVVVARGVNRVTANLDPTAHAEVVAIRAACEALGHFQLTGCIVYSSCEPCPMCLGAIHWARPDAVVWAAGHADAARAGFDDSHIYEQIALAPEQRALPSRQVEHVDALRPFEAWIAHEARTHY